MNQQPTICEKCEVETPVAPGYVMVWLECGEADAKEATRSTSKTHALYWVQQSVEKLVKARLLLLGRCYCPIMDISHGSLKGFLKAIPDIWKDPTTGQLVDKLAGTDARNKLGTVQGLLGDDDGIAELKTWPADVLDSLLGILDRLEEEGEKVFPISLIFGTIPYLSRAQFAEELLNRVYPVLRRRGIRINIPELVTLVLDISGMCDHRLAGEEVSVSTSEVHRWLRWAESEVRLYLLACATFAHESSTRYPAHPNAPEDVRQAAVFKIGDSGRSRRMGGMGFRHYSEEIGVIYYVDRLAKGALSTAKLMQDRLQTEDSIAFLALPPCAACEADAAFD